MYARRVGLAIGIAGLAAGSTALAEPRFDRIGRLPGMWDSRALAVSADGCIVVGQSGQWPSQQALRWQNGVSSNVLPGPHTGYESADGISADGQVVVGTAFGAQAYRLDAYGPSVLSLPGGTPRWATAVSADGQSVGGCVHAPAGGGNCDLPFFWRDGVAVLLPAPDGSTSFGAVHAFSSDGGVAAGRAGVQAAIWRTGDGTVQGLGYLPGLPAYSDVHGLSPDGAIAVGESGSSPSRRAFRWNGATLEDLGALTSVARATSADGSRVVGEGPQGAFVWDAVHGTRLLADVLRDEYGLALGSWHLVSATAMTPDGNTIVGHGYDPYGTYLGWRVRLGEERCPANPGIPVIPLGLDPGDGEPPLEGPSALALAPDGWLYVTGEQSRSLGRIETDLAYLDAPPMDVLVDLSADPEPGVPTVLAAGKPLGWAYAGVFQREELWLLVGSSGNPMIMIPFSGSYLPPIETLWGPQPTAPVDVHRAANTTLYIAANARVMRVDPDELVYELIDSAAASAVVHGSPSLENPPFIDVEVDADGRLLVATPDYLLVLDAGLGSVIEFQEPTALGLEAYGIRGLLRDPEGGLWVYGDGLARVDADGSMQTIYHGGEIPDGAGGTLTGIDSLVVDAGLNLFYTDGGPVVRRTPLGTASRLLEPETLDWLGQPVGTFLASDLAISRDALFVADFSGNRVLRVDLTTFPTRCANGIDDDGDGAVDFPADPGCISAEDEGERSPRHVCDNGLDDDGDGAADWPADAACGYLKGVREHTECDDGLDNDGDGRIDWDGADLTDPDPECAGDPLRVIEHPWYCGLGFEVALVVLPLVTAVRRFRQRNR
jgi:uncharacterized membrane protein